MDWSEVKCVETEMESDPADLKRGCRPCLTGWLLYSAAVLPLEPKALHFMEDACDATSAGGRRLPV